MILHLGIWWGLGLAYCMRHFTHPLFSTDVLEFIPFPIQTGQISPWGLIGCWSGTEIVGIAPVCFVLWTSLCYKMNSQLCKPCSLGSEGWWSKQGVTAF